MHPHHEHAATHSRSPATVRLYPRRFDQFARWCADNGRRPLPASQDTFDRYVVAHVPVGASRNRLAVLATAVRAAQRDRWLPAPRITRRLWAAVATSRQLPLYPALRSARSGSPAIPRPTSAGSFVTATRGPPPSTSDPRP